MTFTFSTAYDGIGRAAKIMTPVSEKITHQYLRRQRWMKTDETMILGADSQTCLKICLKIVLNAL